MKKTRTIEDLQVEFYRLLLESKQQFLDMFKEDVLGIRSVVSGGAKKYDFYGHGCSIAYLQGKGIKGKKYAEAAGGAIETFKSMMSKELQLLYPDKPILPLMTQDITVNSFLQWEASKWFKQNDVTVRTVNMLD